MLTCPMLSFPVAHVGGPILTGDATVRVCGKPAARGSDPAVCVGSVDSLIGGAPMVLIGGRPAVRQGDTTAHGGVVGAGCPTVLIGP